MSLANPLNINNLWAQLIIEELTRNGATYFCLSPGSRCAPLTVAAAENKSCETHIHCDERASAFNALGYSSATGKPAVIITTSGSAVANTFPAIIEASKKKIPLIVLTADRPPELRFTGANQTIDQVKIFGDYARWFFDLPTPTTEIPVTMLLTTIDQAVYKACTELKGPVHLNCMFREPLAPIKKTIPNLKNYLEPLNLWLKHKDPLTRWSKSQLNLSIDQLQPIVKKLNAAKTGIIAVGKLTDEDERAAVLQLAEKLNWPIFADISSGLRLGQSHNHVITYFDQILLSQAFLSSYSPSTILHLGGRLTSQRYYNYIENVKPSDYITILNHSLRNDPLHCVTDRVQSSIGEFIKTITPHLKKNSKSSFLTSLQKANALIDETLDETFNEYETLTEFECTRLLSRIIPNTHNLFLSNSLVIREMDSFADIKGAALTPNANRGASGIDGIVASACGYTNGTNRPTTLIIGDLAALYDLNSFSMLSETKKPIVTILYNNNGGGIFSFLPVAQYKQFEKFFGTPHNITFSHAAEMFGICYTSVKTLDDLFCAYHEALKSKTSTLIEVTTDRKDNIQFFNQWKKRLKQLI